MVRASAATFTDDDHDPIIDAVEALAVLASGENPDGTPYTLPIDVGDGLRVTNTAAVLAAAERAFIGGSGRVSLAAAGNIRATFTNPAGSGRNILITRFQGLSTAVGWAELRINPTTGLPASAPRPTTNSIIAAAAGLGQIRVDTNLATPIGGGVDTGIVLGLPAGHRFLYEFDVAPLTLAPGASLGIGVGYAGAVDLAFELLWLEADLVV